MHHVGNDNDDNNNIDNIGNNDFFYSVKYN